MTIRYFDGDNGSGSSVNLYCDYPNLGTVGWDNRANSAICMVCPSLIGGSDPYHVNRMVSFQEYNMYVAALTHTFNNLKNVTPNIVSSNRLYFD
ncbi:hypothetical protein GCM10017562_44610 [Streptomyces roseofulvus]|uniref:hypothetical protein n=1 Tax=Streptomyces roseofulvus TaxID=33902 RepID=UPI0031FC3696